MLIRLHIPWTAGSMEVATDSHLGLGHRSPYVKTHIFSVPTAVGQGRESRTKQGK